LVADILVTLTVPFPVRVPVPLIVFVAPGVKVTLFATVRFPEALILLLILKPLVLFMLRTLNAIVCEDEPVIDVAAGVPGVLKLTVPEVVNE